MKILVTGSETLLGAAIIKELHLRGMETKTLLTENHMGHELRNPSTNGFGKNLCEEDIFQASQDCSFVIHAGELAPSGIEKIPINDYLEQNLHATKMIIQGATKAGVQRIVYISHACVFKGGSQDDPGDELAEFDGFRYNSGYINSKFLTQQWVLSEVEKRHSPVVIINPVRLIGPGDKSGAFLPLFLKSLSGALQFYHPGVLNLVDVRDAATACCNALWAGKTGECYILSNSSIPIQGFLKRINGIIGQNGHRFPIPPSLSRAAGLLGNVQNFLLEKKHSPSYGDICRRNARHYYSGEKARRVLGLPSRPLEESLLDLLHWYRQEGFIETDNIPFVLTPSNTSLAINI